MRCSSEPVTGTALARLSAANIQEQFKTFDDLIEFTSNPVSRFDSKVVQATTTNINTIVKNYEITTYPLLLEKLNQAPITTIEVAEFINEWGYTDTELELITREIVTTPTPPNDVVSTVLTPPGTADVLRQLDQFYNTNIPASISNSVCSIFGVAAIVFASIKSISQNIDKLDKLKNINSISDIINLTAIKNSINKIIDELKDKYVGQVKNLVNNAVKKIATLEQSAERMFKNLNKKAFEIEEFFSDLNMESLKEKAESVISRMAAQFENVTPESIAFMMFRLCQFVELLDTFMKNPVDRMKALTDLTISQFETVGVMQSVQSVISIVDGSWRMPTSERVSRRASAINNINSRRPEGTSTPVPYVTAQLSESEMQMVRGITASGSDNFYFADSVLNMGKTATAQHNSTGINREWSTLENSPDAGWKYVAMHHPEVFVKLDRIAKRLDVKLKVLSAYRSPWYNRIYQREILGNTGAAYNSKHMSGLALDVAMRNNGVSYNIPHATFAKAASLEGIGGLALYNNFVHIDTASRRTWNTSKALTVEEKKVIQDHTQDAFRKGLA